MVYLSITKCSQAKKSSIFSNKQNKVNEQFGYSYNHYNTKSLILIQVKVILKVDYTCTLVNTTISFPTGNKGLR